MNGCSNKPICRFCKSYRPDERYRGVIGDCVKHNVCRSVTDTCEDNEQGKQYWLISGKEVKE